MSSSEYINSQETVKHPNRRTEGLLPPLLLFPSFAFLHPTVLQALSPRITSRKSARFRGQVMLLPLRRCAQPVSASLQNSFRVFRVPLPASHVTHLTARLPSQFTSVMKRIRFTMFRIMTGIG